MRLVRTRGNKPVAYAPYPLNEFPPNIIQELGRRLVHFIAVGHSEIDGDTFCQMYADCFGAEALGKPLGVADILWNGCAWSVKTIKNKQPHDAQTIRLISGRNSPHYSAGISDPLNDIQATGHAVLDIYNQRISEARKEHDYVRLFVFIRDMAGLRFTMFERSITMLAVNDYEWHVNKRNNLEGYRDGQHCFTWQPHGSQFTIIESVPTSATRFLIKQRPGILPLEHVLRLTRFRSDWIEVL